MATRLGEPVRISKCGRCSVRFSTPGAGSPPWNCPHCDKRIARDALRVRAERRLRCPVCLASIAHRGPCAVTCGRSCAMRLHRARRRIRVASSAPLLCPVCGLPPTAWVGAGAALRDRGCRRAGVCLRAVLDVDRGEDDGAGRGVTVALMATRYPSIHCPNRPRRAALCLPGCLVGTTFPRPAGSGGPGPAGCGCSSLSAGFASHEKDDAWRLLIVARRDRTTPSDRS